MSRLTLAIRLLFVASLLYGCSQVPTPESRTNRAEQLAHGRGWQGFSVGNAEFRLQAYGPADTRPVLNPPLRVYIEGDGLAWISRSRPSNNPTPITPTGLKLALADPSGHAVYLARPCQYRIDAGCSAEYWLSRRFSKEVVTATGAAIDQLKQRYGARSVVLVGYSGGGAIAALVAAQRTDVQALITVAGNLDTQLWTRHHNISPLEGSLNPADYTYRLYAVAQWHFTGEKDVIIPPLIAGAFAKRFAEQAPVHVITLQTYDHYCCWADRWPQLLSMTGLTHFQEDY